MPGGIFKISSGFFVRLKTVIEGNILTRSCTEPAFADAENLVGYVNLCRCQASDLLEQAAEMVGIVEAQQVRHFAHAQAFHKEILGLVNHEIVYITDGGSASGMVNQITEVTC